jgi:hypothetical protein
VLIEENELGAISASQRLRGKIFTAVSLRRREIQNGALANFDDGETNR